MVASETRRHGTTVAAEGIVVEKRFDVVTMPLPAVSYDISSARSVPVEVTLSERLPPDLSPDRIGFHPRFGADGWTCYDERELVWRGVVDPDSTRRIVFGIWFDAPERALSLLSPPNLTSVRGVGDDASPLVLDETFVDSPQPHLERLRESIAETVPADALRDESEDRTTWEDLPDAGTSVAAPTEPELQEVVSAVVGGTATGHGRYYHLRLTVETAGRGARDVSVLEDLTNALSVLYADAEDRDGGSWRVLDVAIGTNWQAERIVTALGDDDRISGLLVTELTGAVNAARSTDERHQSEPDPSEMASAVFGGNAGTAAYGAPRPDDGGASAPRSRQTDGSAPSDDPVQKPSVSDDAVASFGADACDEFGTDAVDAFGGFERATGTVDEDQAGTAACGDSSSTAAEVSSSTAAEVSSSTAAEVSSSTTAEVSSSTTVEVSSSTTVESAGDDTVEDVAGTFAELKAEVDPVGFDELEAELDEYDLTPDSEEEFSIAELLADEDEQLERTSV
ncbi:hypothetical protein [Haloarchaeobius sp. TZWWS8]|uniref:hypothetical protein n=1 Tax=Haloarchaeobius sp. TZWWS8 TaxID=3446121 RepID=UPI003EBC9936